VKPDSRLHQSHNCERFLAKATITYFFRRYPSHFLLLKVKTCCERLRSALPQLSLSLTPSGNFQAVPVPSPLSFYSRCLRIAQTQLVLRSGLRAHRSF